MANRKSDAGPGSGTANEGRARGTGEAASWEGSPRDRRNGREGRDPTRGSRTAAATREALMDAATELFAERGFEGTRVELIAELAGVNKAMISYHFGGKKGLYAVILEAAFAVAKDRFRRIRSSAAPADRRLREFIDTFGDLATLRPGLPAMVIREVLSGGMHMDEALLPHFLEMFALVHEIIDQGVQEGSFRAVDPFLTHLTLFGSLTFFFATLPLGTKFIERGMLPTRVPLPQEYVEHLKEFMVRAVSIDTAQIATPIGEDNS